MKIKNKNIIYFSISLIIMRLGLDYIANMISPDLILRYVDTSVGIKPIRWNYFIQTSGNLISTLGLEWLVLFFTKEAKKAMSSSIFYILILLFLIKESISTIERILVQLAGIDIPLLNSSMGNSTYIFSLSTIMVFALSIFKYKRLDFSTIPSDKYIPSKVYKYRTRPIKLFEHIRSFITGNVYGLTGYIIDGYKYNRKGEKLGKFKNNSNYKLYKLDKSPIVLKYELGISHKKD